MSMLLRLMAALALTCLLVTGCSKPVEDDTSAKPEAVEATPAPVVESSGGYLPSADERVPGITIDATALDAAAKAAANKPATK